MAKKAIQPARQYSLSDQCLIAILSEPIKRHQIKKYHLGKVDSGKSLIYQNALENAVISSSSSSTSTTSPKV